MMRRGRRRRRRNNSCAGRDERKAYKTFVGKPKQADQILGVSFNWRPTST